MTVTFLMVMVVALFVMLSQVISALILQRFLVYALKNVVMESCWETINAMMVT